MHAQLGFLQAIPSSSQLFVDEPLMDSTRVPVELKASFNFRLDPHSLGGSWGRLQTAIFLAEHRTFWPAAAQILEGC